MTVFVFDADAIVRRERETLHELLEVAADGAMARLVRHVFGVECSVCEAKVREATRLAECRFWRLCDRGSALRDAYNAAAKRVQDDERDMNRSTQGSPGVAQASQRDAALSALVICGKCGDPLTGDRPGRGFYDGSTSYGNRHVECGTPKGWGVK